MRWLKAGLLTAGLVLLPAVPAYGVAIDDESAEELRALLAEAQQVQGICYSYELTIVDSSGSEDTREQGASWAPANSRTIPESLPATCKSQLHLRAYVTYTAESSESEDSGNYSVQFTDPSGNIAFKAQNAVAPRASADVAALLRDPGDAVFDRMSAMPGIVAAANLAPYLPLEVRTEPAAQGDALTGSTGSDFWRTKSTSIIWLSLGVLVSASLAAYAIWQMRSERERDRRRQRFTRMRSGRRSPTAADADNEQSSKEETT